MKEKENAAAVSKMARIKKTDTKPEMIVRKYLFSHGLRYRLHDKKLIGNPDIVFKKIKTVVFINGCFWHAHDNCKLNRIPKQNKEYWEKKISGNKIRDRKNAIWYIENGWNIITIWECELKRDKIENTLTTLLSSIATQKNVQWQKR